MSATAISLPRLARHNPLAAIGAIFVAFFVICAIFAPWIAPQDPAHISLASRLAPPSLLQICGSDELGRDILSRLIYGSRISMLVGSCVVGASLGIGLIIGSISGYYGCPRPWCNGRADSGAAYLAEHRSAGHRASRNRHGGSDSC